MSRRKTQNSENQNTDFPARPLKKDLTIGANKVDGKEMFFISHKHKLGDRTTPRDAGYLCTDGKLRRTALPLKKDGSFTGYFDTIEKARRALEKYGV